MFTKSATLALASLVLFVQATAAEKCVREYTVKEGDYCDTISAAHKVSTFQLSALNADKINTRCDNLEPGQKLCLGTEGEDCEKVKVIVPGNTCEAIWTKYKLDKKVFYENNPQVEEKCGNIYVDEVLCVETTVLRPASPKTPTFTGPPASEATPPVPVADKKDEGKKEVKEPVKLLPAPAVVEDDFCEDEYEEVEVVVGHTDEDLPFCDELGDY